VLHLVFARSGIVEDEVMIWERPGDREDMMGELLDKRVVSMLLRRASARSTSDGMKLLRKTMKSVKV
jgi:hypothetical protein